MYVYDITLRFRDGAEAHEREYAAVDFFCALSADNRILFETVNVSCRDGVHIARVTVPYRDSLEETNYGTDTRAALERLSEYLSEPMTFAYVGEDFFYGAENFSTWEEADGLVLCIHPRLRDLSPICSGRGMRNIPYYLLPPLSKKCMRELTAWSTNYAAYDQLFTATGVGEMSAHKMLSQVQSPLNRRGREVCRLLEEELGRPVYYYLFRFYGKNPPLCPSCGGEWSCGEDAEFAYRCDGCRLVARATAKG